MSAHTPGPWFVSDNADVGFDVCAKDRPVVGDCGVETLADAHLIAAAPDLLDALRDLDSRLRACFAIPGVADAYDSAYQESVAEAIAKATGAA